MPVLGDKRSKKFIMGFEFKKIGFNNVDDICDELIKNNGAVISDTTEGENLVLGKAARRRVLISFDYVIVDILVEGDVPAIALNANDGQNTLLMQHSTSLIKHKDALMGLIVEQNKVVKTFLTARQESIRKRMAVQKPTATPRN